MIFRNGHMIVVDDDNQGGAGLRGGVQPFISFAAAQRAVSDHGNDIVRLSFQIPRLGKSAGEAD